MVVFTCNHCGESLQKPKVEKHYFTVCRRAKALTCVDCMKDFLNEEYVAHTKCVTEEERYAAKGAFSKPLVKKGEVKQESWTEVIQSVIAENSSNVKPSQKQILAHLGTSTNVPRKKVKFMNFIKNAISKRTADVDIEEVWNLIEKYKGQHAEKEVAATEKKSEVDQSNIENAKQETVEGSKKRKKSKNLDGEEKEAIVANEETSKKKKHKNVDENTDAVEDIKVDESLKKKKKKKGKNGETAVTGEDKIEANGAAVEIPVTTDVSKDLEETKKVEDKSNADAVNDIKTDESLKKKKKKKAKNGETCGVGEEKVDSNSASLLNNAVAVKTSEATDISNNVKATEGDANDSITVDGGKKKKRKSKNLNDSVIENTNVASDVQAETEPSKKKKKLTENGDKSVTQQTEQNAVESEKKLDIENSEETKMENGEDESQNSTKFYYEGKILEILKTKQSMSLKKLQKKVLDAYQKLTGIEPTPKVIKKFNKHLKKTNGVELSENTVTFISG